MAGEVGPVLWERALALQEAQVRSWPALARGHEALREALWREWKIDGWTVKAQCNQARAASNKAKVDPRAVQERPCFLCAENRPSEQEALEWGEEWWILANPAPLFSHHFTVTLKRHGREHILGKLDAFLRLARDLSPGLSVFYNGPRSGASAPDHFHFQAYTAGSLPIEEEAMGPEGPGRGVLARAASGGTSAAVVEAAGRAFLLVRGEARDGVISVLRKTIARLGGESGDGDPWAEPDLNLIASYRDGGWSVALFPRRAHRPACYFREEPERLLASPGGADMGGMFVLVRKRDLERLDPPAVLEIYREVAFSGPQVLSRLVPERLLEG